MRGWSPRGLPGAGPVPLLLNVLASSPLLGQGGTASMVMVNNAMGRVVSKVHPALYTDDRTELSQAQAPLHRQASVLGEEMEARGGEGTSPDSTADTRTGFGPAQLDPEAVP